jgi:tetratricopeptide (TPR) repeat protein
VNLHALEVALDGQLPPDRDVDDCVAALVEHALMKPGKKGRFNLSLAVREVAESTLSNREEALRRHTKGVIASIGEYWRENVRALANLEGQRFLADEAENLLRVLERVRGHDVDAWCKIVLCLASVWHSAGMVRRAHEEITAALEACESTRYAPHLLLVLGCVLRAIEQETAVDALLRAEASLQAPDEQHLQMVCLRELLMIGATGDNDDKRADYLQRAETLAQGAPELRIEIELCRAWIAVNAGLPEQALEHVQNLEASDLNTIRRFSTQLMGLVVRFRLEREEATAKRFRRAAEEALSLGDVFKQALALTWAGQAESRAGQFAAAVNDFGRAETIYRRGGAQEWAGILNGRRKEALAKMNAGSA